jgi:alanyl-tRNA synthetase
LINGSATSYIDVFQDALKYLQNAVGQEINQEIWDKLGPYSCTLNIDEVENIEQTW